MSRVYDCTDDQIRDEAVGEVGQVVRDGGVVVLPTDTVYGIGADAFMPDAVERVLAAKGRGRDMPPPVLVPSKRTLDGLTMDPPPYVRTLVRLFWPGPLTLVVRAQPSLHWDLGETRGTVALRMPKDETALMLLSEVGPMAVTSANRTGHPAATTVEEARDQLGDAVDVYLDAGESGGAEASTIVDCTGEVPVVLRHGALSASELRAALGATGLHDSPEDAEASERETYDSGYSEGRDAEVEDLPEIDVAPDEPHRHPDGPAYGVDPVTGRKGQGPQGYDAGEPGAPEKGYSQGRGVSGPQGADGGRQPAYGVAEPSRESDQHEDPDRTQIMAAPIQTPERSRQDVRPPRRRVRRSPSFGMAVDENGSPTRPE